MQTEFDCQILLGPSLALGTPFRIKVSAEHVGSFSQKRFATIRDLGNQALKLIPKYRDESFSR